MSGTIALETGEYSVNEADGSVSVTIVRTGDLSTPVTIDYGVNADTAQAGVDFIDNDGQITMEAGQSEAVVTIQIVNDQASEATEVFNFSLINVDDGFLTFPRTARINILDDENPVPDVPTPPLTSDYIVDTHTVASGYNQPISLEFMPGNDGQALLVTKPGQIFVVDTTTGQQLSTLLDIRSEVNGAADRGLLDVAIHPDFESNPYLYAFYVVDPPETANLTGNAGQDGDGNRFSYVVRYELDTSGSVPTIVAGSKTILLGGAATGLSDISGNGAINSTTIDNVGLMASDIDPLTGEYKQDYLKVDSLSHAGGALEFGPDGMLYVGVGDGTSFDLADPRSVSVQSLDALAGKILRIDPITGQGLTDNPFYEDGMDLDSNQSKVYQLGLRNPYTMAIDDNGHIYVSNTGWFSYEEIESGPAGANFGWPYYEGGDNGQLVKTPDYQYLAGADAFYAAVESGAITIQTAFRAFSHANGDPGYQVQAIVGASDIFKSDAYDGMFKDYYFFTDVSQGEVFAVNVNDRRDIIYLYTADSGFGPVHFTQGPDGLLYYVDLLGGGFGYYNIQLDPNGGGGTDYPPTFVDDVPAETQFLEGTPGVDTFVINGNFADYGTGQTDDRNSVVVWNDSNYDVLTAFEFIRFNDRTIDLSKLLQPGPDYQDDPQNNLQLTGVTDHDRFIIDGLSSNFNWGPTAAGDGTIVYDATGYDILNGFEQIVFSDRTVTLADEPNGNGGGGGGETPIETLYYDNAANVEYFAGSTDAAQTDVFVVAANSSLYSWASTASGDGVVIWTNDAADTTYDILYNFETIRFADGDVDVRDVPGSNLPGGGGTQDDVVSDIAASIQYLDGGDGTDTFVIAGNSSLYGWASTESGDGVVIWTLDTADTTYDILYNFETIQFANQTIDVSTLPGNGNGGGGGTPATVVNDVPNQVQYLSGTTENDVFAINGNSNQFGWGPTESGDGVVVWGDSGYDILTGFEALQFNDRVVDISHVLDEGPVYYDIADQIQYLTGKSNNDVFVIDGSFADYDWSLTGSV